MQKQRSGWNQVEIFAQDCDKEWGVELFHQIAAVFVVNKTTGDKMMLQYMGEGGTAGYVSNMDKVRYEEFLRAPGEKAALVTGCNIGALDANYYMKQFKEAMNDYGVQWIDIDPAAFQLTSGYGVYHHIYINPQDAGISIYTGEECKELHTARPFGDFTPFMPSEIERINNVAYFISTALYDLKPLTGRELADQRTLQNQVDYVGHTVKNMLNAIPTTDEALQHIKDACSRPAPKGSRGLVRMDQLTNAPRIIEKFHTQLSVLFDAVVELAQSDVAMPGDKRRAIDMMVAEMKTACTQMNNIALKEHMPELAQATANQLDTLRNLHGRRIA